MAPGSEDFAESYNTQSPDSNYWRDEGFGTTGKPHTANVNELVNDTTLVEGTRIVPFDEEVALSNFPLGAIALESNGTVSPTYASLDTFFDRYNLGPNGLDRPTSWEDFINQFRIYQAGIAPGNLPPPTSGLAYTAFKENFNATTGYNLDWGPGGQNLITNADPYDPDAQFQAAFAEFLRTFPYGSDGTIAGLPGATVGSGQLFFENWALFLTQVGKVDQSGINVTNTYFMTASKDLIASYEQLYDQMLVKTGITTVPFETAFRDYYFNTVEKKGYFHSGRAFDGWVERVWEQFLDTRLRPTKTVSLGDELLISRNFQNAELVTVTGQDISQITISIIDPATGNPPVTPEPADNLQLGTNSLAAAGSLHITSITNADGTVTPIDLTVTIDSGFGGGSITLQADRQITGPEAIEIMKAVRYINTNATSGANPNGNEGIKNIAVTFTRPGGPDDIETELVVDANPISGTYQSVVTSVSSEHSKRVIVLDRIFRLLAQIIGSLQSVAAAQAQQITFLASWQRVFTDMITQIETFARDDKSIFGGTSTTNATTESTLSAERGDANSAQVTRRETLSAWRGIVQDTAKREQTRVNQSQDAVSQQANIATAIIQQLTTILGTIFR